MAYTPTTWIDGVTKVNASNMNKIETQLDTVSDDVDTNTTNYANHIAGTADKHYAQNIVYSGEVAGATEVEEALDLLDARIDNLILGGGTSPDEVVDARSSGLKSKTFTTLDGRLESIEMQLGYHSKDIGMVGDDSNNDATQLNTWITSIGSSNATLYLSEGTYKIATNVVFPANIVIKPLLGAVLKVYNTYSITGTNTRIEAGLYQIFDLSLSGSSGIAGTWNIEYVYPEWFGAVGDGTTDDSTAMQYAINFSITSAAPVSLRAVDYKCDNLSTSGTLYLEGKKRSSIAGGSRIMGITNTNDILTTTGPTFHCQGVTFVGTGKNDGGTQNALVFGDSSNVVNDVSILDTWFTDISNACIKAEALQGATIQSCYLENAKVGIEAICTSGSKQFANCVIDACRFYAIAVTGISLKSAGGNASSVKWNTISNNVFDFIGTTSSDSGAIALDDDANLNTIIGNNFNNQRCNDIYLNSCNGNIIKSNNHNRTGRRAIYEVDCSDNIIVANEIVSCNYFKTTHGDSLSAIELNNSDNGLYAENKIWSWSGEERHTYGFAFTNSPAGYRMYNNQVANALTSSYQTTVNVFEYEQNTFTPVLYGDAVAGTNTYSTQLGYYTKNGNCINFQISIVMTAKDGTMAGAIRISGLPYAAKSGIADAVCAIGTENVAIAASNYLGGIVGAGLQYIKLLTFDSAGATTVGAADIANDSVITLTGSYII